MRPSSLYLVLLSLPSSFGQTANNGSLTSTKRGLAYVTPKNSQDNHYWDSTSSGLTWYYNYSPSPTSALSGSGLEFVPMLFGQPASGSNFSASVEALMTGRGGPRITAVLAFNEPDNCDGDTCGSCLTAADAAAIWQAQVEPLKALGLKLGAPAVTGAPSGFTWLQNFFAACAGRCSADFLPVHWYGDFEGLAAHIGQVNATYGANMTAWVTEFADAGASLADSQSFYNQSIALLNRWSYVERYAYFGAFRSSVSNVGPNAAMLDQNGQLTDIGAWYLGEAATGNIPKSAAAKPEQFTACVVLSLVAMFYMIL